MQRAIAGVLLLGVAAAWGDATLTLPTFIASHMVLQRAPLQARLWGWTKPGKNVTATLDQDLTITTTAGASGEWELEFAPQVAGSGHTIEIHDGTSSITLADVAFGDVWLCSGQSNMEFSVNTAFNASAELADSASYPDLRLATVKKAVAPTPLPDIGSKSNYSWARSGPDAMVGVGGPTFSWFSATCYFFGRDLHKALQVPIGLVASDWGGQRVESFSSPDALADKTCGGLRPESSGHSHLPPGHSQLRRDNGVAPPSAVPYPGVVIDALRAKATTSERGEHYYRVADEPNPGPTQLWNAMIAPLTSTLPANCNPCCFPTLEFPAGGGQLECVIFIKLLRALPAARLRSSSLFL